MTKQSHWQFQKDSSMMKNEFKQNQIVVFIGPPKGFPSCGYPWEEGEHLLYFGEVLQMPGHCVVVNKKGRVFWGYHTDNFREPTEDEV